MRKRSELVFNLLLVPLDAFLLLGSWLVASLGFLLATDTLAGSELLQHLVDVVRPYYNRFISSPHCPGESVRLENMIENQDPVYVSEVLTTILKLRTEYAASKDTQDMLERGPDCLEPTKPILFEQTDDYLSKGIYITDTYHARFIILR
jgi:hypothetical protein